MTQEAAAKKDTQRLQRAIVDGLEDVKAQDIQVFNTEHLSPLFERVIVASGTSNRQTKALASSVRDAVREAGFPKPRIEGEENGEWIIVDCGAAVAHIMQPAIRQYYHLEEIWGDKPVRLKFGAPKPAAPAAAESRRRRRRRPARRSARRRRGQDAKAAARTANKATAKTAAAKTATAKKATAKKADTAKTPAKAPAKRAPARKAAAGRKGRRQEPPAEGAGPASMKLVVVAVGQRVPDWAQTAWDDYAKRFPPELRVELRAVKTEPRASKTLESLYAAERQRIEAAIPKGAHVVALDERGTALTTMALAGTAQGLAAAGRRRGAGDRRPRRARSGLQAGGARAHPPVGPDLAARHGARAAGRAAVPRLVDQREPSVSP